MNKPFNRIEGFLKKNLLKTMGSLGKHNFQEALDTIFERLVTK